MKYMAMAIIMACFVAQAESLSPAQAMSNLRMVTDNVPMKAAEHRILERSYAVLAGALIELDKKQKEAKAKDDGAKSK